MKTALRPARSALGVLLSLLLMLSLFAPAALADGTETDPATGRTTVRVTTADELIAAIGPNTTVLLAPGTYNITQSSSYGGRTGNPYCGWNSTYYEGSALQIHDVANFELRAESDDRTACEIVSEFRMADVLTFQYCSDITLTGITLGHTEQSEACEGGVLTLEGCDSVSVTGCGLFGCGTTGITASDCTGLSVTDTDIYHCSGMGVSLSSCYGTAMENCRFYDCGSEGVYSSAYAVFCLCEVKNAHFRSCEVYGNYVDELIAGYSIKSASFEDLNVHDNHFDTVFGYDGGVAIDGLTFTDNHLNDWFFSREGSSGTGSVAFGSLMTSDDLTALYADQMNSSGVGTSAVQAREPDLSEDGRTVVHVTTADEFVSAIASDTVIYLDAASINLADASAFAAAQELDYWECPAVSAEEFESTKAVFRPTYDGPELWLGGVTNLTVIGSVQGGSEIVTEPRYANVLSLIACSGVTFENVTLGHTTEPGACSGGVVYLQDSTDVLLSHCDLYGCGIYGIQALNTSGLFVQNSRIHDCSYGAATFEECSGVHFFSTIVENCPSKQFMLMGCEDFTWEQVQLDPYTSFDAGDIVYVG